MSKRTTSIKLIVLMVLVSQMIVACPCPCQSTHPQCCPGNCSQSCINAEPSAPVPEKTVPVKSCDCPVQQTQVLDCSDGSQVVIQSGTNIEPCGCMEAQYISRNDLPDQACMPTVNVITAIDVRPDGVEFTPDAELHFKLPASHPYWAGYKLKIWQHTSGTCNLSTKQTNWIAEPGNAVVNSTKDFADGPMRHTTIFALVEMVSEFNVYAVLATSFEANNDGISFGIEILDSFSNPDYETAEFTVVVTGLESEDPYQLADELNQSIPVGSPITLQFDSNQFTIWSGPFLREFYAASMDVNPGLP